MRIQRKLLIGFLAIASIGSGVLAYNNQMAESLKTNVEYSKDVADTDTSIEDTNLSETANNTEDTLQSPDKTKENQTPEGETPESASLDATATAPSETKSKDNKSSEKSPTSTTPAKSIPEESTPVESAPAKSAPTEKAPVESKPTEKAPAVSAPQQSTPANNIPGETQNTEDTQLANSSPTVDTSKRRIITYEELEKYARSSNGTEGNNQPDPSVASPDTTAPETSPSLNSDYANQVLSILNQERANAGLPPLTMNQGAVNAAAVRAKEIVSSFSHTRPNGQSPFTALGEAGVSYRAAGENIAYGQKSPTEVMNGWMNSSGHRANILSSNFTQVGIACYDAPNSQNGYYWVQLFIG